MDAALEEMRNRGAQVPGGICGLWGTCGAAVSTGIFVSLITGASPLSGKEWGLCNEMTSRSLGAIAKTGGPDAVNGIPTQPYWRQWILWGEIRDMDGAAQKDSMRIVRPE